MRSVPTLRTDPMADQDPKSSQCTATSKTTGVSIVPKCIQESRKDSLIDVECRLSQAAVSAHPRPVLAQDWPVITSARGNSRSWKLTLVLEESDENGARR